MMKFGLSRSTHSGHNGGFVDLGGDDDSESSVDDASAFDDCSFACDASVQDDSEVILLGSERDLQDDDDDEAILLAPTNNDNAAAPRQPTRTSSFSEKEPPPSRLTRSLGGIRAMSIRKLNQLKELGSGAAAEEPAAPSGLSLSSHGPSRPPRRLTAHRSLSSRSLRGDATSGGTKSVLRTKSSPLSGLPSSSPIRGVAASKSSSSLHSVSSLKGEPVKKTVLGRTSSRDDLATVDNSLSAQLKKDSMSSSSHHRPKPVRRTSSNSSHHKRKSRSRTRRHHSNTLSSSSRHGKKKNKALHGSKKRASSAPPLRQGISKSLSSPTARADRKTPRQRGVDRHASDKVVPVSASTTGDAPKVHKLVRKSSFSERRSSSSNKSAAQPDREGVEWVEPSQDEVCDPFVQLSLAGPAIALSA